MSAIKAFAEQVSVEMGYGGELNNTVLREAQRRLDGNIDNEAHRQKCVVQGHVDSLVTDPFEGEQLEVRADGRVELICHHGCGHPSLKLQTRPPNSTDGVHGCCGCCQHPSFKETEDRLLQRRKA